MQGTYIDSGAESGDASSTELVYTVQLAKSGSIQFTYTSDGERYYDYLRTVYRLTDLTHLADDRYYDYLHFYIDNVEQEIDSEYGCALRSLVAAIIRSSSVPSTHIAHAVQHSRYWSAGISSSRTGESLSRRRFRRARTRSSGRGRKTCVMWKAPTRHG